MSMGWQASNYQPFNITLKGVVLLEIYENLSLEDMEGEVWRDIKGYEGLYQISNLDRVIFGVKLNCQEGECYEIKS